MEAEPLIKSAAATKVGGARCNVAAAHDVEGRIEGVLGRRHLLGRQRPRSHRAGRSRSLARDGGPSYSLRARMLSARSAPACAPSLASGREGCRRGYLAGAPADWWALRVAQQRKGHKPAE